MKRRSTAWLIMMIVWCKINIWINEAIILICTGVQKWILKRMEERAREND